MVNFISHKPSQEKNSHYENGSGNGFCAAGPGEKAESVVMAPSDLKAPPIRVKNGGNHQCLSNCLESVEAKLDAEWQIQASPAAVESINPIRELLESLTVVSLEGKEKISLAQGDPTAFGHLKVPESAVDAMVAATKSYMFNGYTHSGGSHECRKAVADYHSSPLPFELTAEDVCIAVGCSQAIQLCVAALATAGANMLIPRPGFPIYETFCKYYGVECRHYDLIPERDWEVNLDQVAALADENTAAWFVCNPSNPCGSVYKYQHLAKIANLAERLRVPIISDEIYANMTFGATEFTPMATFSMKVPVLTVGGVSKRWLAPGWRLGWIIVGDPKGILHRARIVVVMNKLRTGAEIFQSVTLDLSGLSMLFGQSSDVVMEALTRLMQMTIGTSTLSQAAVVGMLQNTPSKFFEDTMKSLQAGADYCYKRVQRIEGLDCPTKPQGAMYIMVRIDPTVFKGIHSDVEFAALLVEEESVIVLPGAAFGTSNWIRIVFATPLDLLEEAWNRIDLFCLRHINPTLYTMAELY